MTNHLSALSSTFYPWLIVLIGCLSAFHVSAGGKFIGTSGVTQVEGSAGGGLVPWATITGYATRDEQSSTAFGSYVKVDDFTMFSYGAAHGYKDRVELSFARQDFKVKDSGDTFSQNVFGMKVRVTGDLIYSPWPQVSLGVQHKRNLNSKDIDALGARNSHGTDYYLAATKAWLDGPFHRNFVVNTIVRYSKANQLGLLGFGGDKDDDYQWLFESSVGLFLNRQWVVGAEYRQKPNNLSAIEEDDWIDSFVAYFPSKSISITAAALDLGSIGGLKDQKGGYLSLQAAF